ncbi:SIR2 family protein [Bradyrhizobium sp. RT10b]|uniref:SIR2 family NAD-dependent protein deacylase n=1 Tax=Bradyrhizobium sp. RT10b TaxID=3156331 RepID=UPI0033941AB5
MPQVSELADFPALRQVQQAIWGTKEIRGAAVMVGAGFSKFAQLASQDGRSPPLWGDFATEMRKRLDGDNLPNDPLGLAEQYGVALGRHALDALIRELVSDHQWTPGDLHSRLLGLPWADVLTTNWDTLLERTQLQEPDRSYEVVRVMSDIARTRAPRIVKLHGSLPAHEPFIFTAEDFRTYPRRFAPFVNLAQQVLLENELCLIGFSGDDPNFLQWSGWVRDQLGASARKIRLVGVLNLSPSRRLVLEHHNISAIDLAPLVEGLEPNEQHRRAMTIFIDSLWEAKPQPLHVWSRSRARAAERAKVETAAESEAFLLSLCQTWRSERISYPGWLVAPFHERKMMWQDTISTEMWRALPQATAETRAKLAYELIWRCETSFAPIGVNLKALVEDVLQHHRGLSVLERVEIQLALLRAARRRRDWAEFDKLAHQLAQFDRSHIEPSLAYERALRCRDELDFEGLEKAVSAVDGDDPVWMIRRSALQCALGNDDLAAEILLRAWNEIKQRRAQDRESIWLLSREAWAAWLMSRARFKLSKMIQKGDEFERWPVKYKAADCDPWDETTHFDHEMSAESDRRVKASERFEPRFDAGTYRDQSHSVRFGSDASSFDELRALADYVGLSGSIDHVDVLGTRFVRSLELVQRASGDVVWSAAIHLPGTDGLIDKYFSRNAVARLPLELVSTLATRLQQAIDYGRKRFTNLRWVGQTVRHTELLSRLVVRLPAEDAQRIFNWAVVLSEDSQWVHWWLFEPLENLLCRSLEGVPPAKHKELTLAAIRLKLPKEVSGSQGIERYWPELAFRFRSEDYAARDESHAWSHRIAALIDAIRTERNLSRSRAIWRLVAMHDADALKDAEKANFGEALWSRRDGPDGFPDHAELYGHVFLRLPEPQVGIAHRTFALKVVKTLCEGEINEFALKSLCGSARDNKGNLIAAPVSIPDALAIFDKCVEWKPREVERHDIFGHDRQNNRDIGGNIGSCLSDAILPAIRADDLGAELTAKWIAALADGSVESLVQTAPELALKFPERKEDAISFVRRGLAGRSDVAVYSAALAVNRFIKYHAAETVAFPMVLSADIVAICSARRDPGLLMALGTARRLLDANLVSQEDRSRLVEALELLLPETDYDDWDDRDPRTRTLSLIRQHCVQLAQALKKRGASGKVVDDWLLTGATDPVPEVRFALSRQMGG